MLHQLVYKLLNKYYTQEIDAINNAKELADAYNSLAEADIQFHADHSDIEASYRLVDAARKRVECAKHKLVGSVKALSVPPTSVPQRVAQLQATNEMLLDKVRNLKRQLTIAIANNRQRNLDLDALHYVWCSGGCESGVHRYSHDLPTVTEELVKTADQRPISES